MSDEQLLVFVLGAFVFMYFYWDLAETERTPRRKTLLKTLRRPVRYDPNEGCYEPFCTGAYKRSSAGPGTERVFRVGDQERVKKFYENRIDLEHARSHTSPLYSGDVSTSANAVCDMVDNEVNASNRAWTTTAPAVYMRGDAYPAHESIRPGMSARDV
jgi:hypothetical protein